MGDFIRPEALKRSQDCGDFFRFNGAIYTFDVRKFMEYGEIRYTDESFAYVMENQVSFDIEKRLDFELADFFYEQRGLNSPLHSILLLKQLLKKFQMLLHCYS
jgi:N-acylneuraminate cytidylyltransferase